MNNLVPLCPTAATSFLCALAFACRDARNLNSTNGGPMLACRALLLAKAERGELEPALVEYLLDAAGVS